MELSTVFFDLVIRSGDALTVKVTCAVVLSPAPSSMFAVLVITVPLASGLVTTTANVTVCCSRFLTLPFQRMVLLTGSYTAEPTVEVTYPA